MRFATCHPDRKHVAHGQCRDCYFVDLKKRNPQLSARQSANARNWVLANPTKAKVIRDRYRHTPGGKHQARIAIRKQATLDKLAEQGNQCGLCGRSDVQKWHWDHDHATGVMRDVLCSRCNNGLGFFQDSAPALRQAADYLDRHEAK